jgi:hypothetical protein
VVTAKCGSVSRPAIITIVLENFDLSEWGEGYLCDSVWTGTWNGDRVGVVRSIVPMQPAPRFHISMLFAVLLREETLCTNEPSISSSAI